MGLQGRGDDGLGISLKDFLCWPVDPLTENW